MKKFLFLFLIFPITTYAENVDSIFENIFHKKDNVSFVIYSPNKTYIYNSMKRIKYLGKKNIFRLKL